METINMKSTITLFDRANSQLQNTIFQCSHYHSLRIFTRHEQQQPACCAHKNLYGHPVCLSTQRPLPHCAHTHCSVFRNIQQALMNVNGYHFFPPWGIQWHTFASYALPCQTTFCQTAPLLPAVTQQQNIMEHWQEGSISTANTTNVHLWHCGPAS